MNFIVFDLEWNQSPEGKKYSNRRLPFEIIEIGAVKLNERKETVDTFHRLIKPQVYSWIHNSIREVIHVNYKDLETGTPFPQAVREFIEWCGDDWYFCTWGNQDVMELQRNMKYYELLYLLPGPVAYYDIQKLFSACFGEGESRRSLEYAIDFLGIKKGEDFHRAFADAFYTAKVLTFMENKKILPFYSLDVYQNPKNRKEEIRISYPTYDKFISREFSSRERTIKDREVSSTKCPVCHKPAKRKIRWFMNNSKIYYSVSNCQEHGYIIGKIRIRKTEEGLYFAIKTLKPASIEEAEEIREKREALRLKKQLKRRSEKEL